MKWDDVMGYKPMRILAFYAPYPQAGKSLAARWAARRANMHPISFAIPLRNAVNDIINFPNFYRVVNPPKDKEAIIPHLGVSWRQMMIAFGNAGRGLSVDFWVRIMAHRMTLQPYDYVIDDLRFQSEYDFLRSKGAKIVRIENPGREVVLTMSEGRLEGNPFDAVIANPLENLRAYLRNVDEVVKAFWP